MADEIEINAEKTCECCHRNKRKETIIYNGEFYVVCNGCYSDWKFGKWGDKYGV